MNASHRQLAIASGLGQAADCEQHSDRAREK